MAQSAIMISYGHHRQHTDVNAVFEAAERRLAQLAEWKQRGLIESFQPFAKLDGNRMECAGFVIIEGDRAQLLELVESPTWMEDRLESERDHFNYTVNWISRFEVPDA